MGEDPSAIREEIEQTRSQMGDTVAALGYKADVGARARDKVDSLKSKVTGAMPSPPGVGGVADGVRDGAQSAAQGARRAAGMAQQNPLGLALGGFALGIAAGLLLPSTRIEDERVGEVSDQVKEKVRETGQEAVEHGRQIAQEAVDQGRHVAEEAVQQGREVAQEAAQTVQQRAGEHVEELRDSAQQKAQEAGQQAGGGGAAA